MTDLQILYLSPSPTVTFVICCMPILDLHNCMKQLCHSIFSVKFLLHRINTSVREKTKQLGFSNLPITTASRLAFMCLLSKLLLKVQKDDKPIRNISWFITCASSIISTKIKQVHFFTFESAEIKVSDLQTLFYWKTQQLYKEEKSMYSSCSSSRIRLPARDTMGLSQIWTTEETNVSQGV